MPPRAPAVAQARRFHSACAVVISERALRPFYGCLYGPKPRFPYKNSPFCQVAKPEPHFFSTPRLRAAIGGLRSGSFFGGRPRAQTGRRRPRALWAGWARGVRLSALMASLRVGHTAAILRPGCRSGLGRSPIRRVGDPRASYAEGRGIDLWDSARRKKIGERRTAIYGFPSQDAQILAWRTICNRQGGQSGI